MGHRRSVTTITTLVIQSKAENRRHRVRLASELALEQWKVHTQLAAKSREMGTPPPGVYAYFYMRMLELMEQGKFTPEEAGRLNREVDQLIKVAKQSQVDVM